MSHPSCHPGRLTRGPTDAGTPVGPRMPAKETQPSHRARVSMPTLIVYLQEAAKGAPARRRCRMIAGAAALTAVLPLSVPLGGCGSGITSPRASR